ncbi:MAG: epoxyqueuosine reductase [Butyricicoccus sp.]|nr:epoxyqueuosine reductase [Butyricicoccus sp.]
MTWQALQTAAAEFLQDCKENNIAAKDALRPDLAGLQIYGAPLYGVAAANDPLFETLRDPAVVSPNAWLPTDWLNGAKSVLSFFLPFTAAVRQSNRGREAPSDEWLHARIEGQRMMDRFGVFLRERLEENGFAAVYPAADPRFGMLRPFASNWSERHTAYICGLGTFGLSKGLITEKGMAGRFGSVITTAELPVTERPYDDPFAYCTMCGKCAKNCPAGAIDPRKGVACGKDHAACQAYLKQYTYPPHGPHARVRYGCGKCQVGVPCEHGIPHR